MDVVGQMCKTGSGRMGFTIRAFLDDFDANVSES